MFAGHNSQTRRFSTTVNQMSPSTPEVVTVPRALSPSRASDFQQCPLLFRFRSIDKLPTAPSSAATRGTVVHAALEGLYDLPAPERTLEAATALIEPSWQAVIAKDPEVAVVADDEGLGVWLEKARDLVGTYFAMEDPQRLEPTGRELFVQTTLDSGLILRGFIDRLDGSPAGDIRIVDYKTGKSPNPRFQDKALFQMRFYGLVLWRNDGVLPRQLKLMFLGDGRPVIDEPSADVLTATENKIVAIWNDIEDRLKTGVFEPKTNKLCDWCDFQSLCPAFGGEPPLFPTITVGSPES